MALDGARAHVVLLRARRAGLPAGALDGEVEGGLAALGRLGRVAADELLLEDAHGDVIGGQMLGLHVFQRFTHLFHGGGGAVVLDVIGGAAVALLAGIACGDGPDDDAA